MSQNYTPTEWVDNRTVGTASVMNNMEKGIEINYTPNNSITEYYVGFKTVVRETLGLNTDRKSATSTNQQFKNYYYKTESSYVPQVNEVINTAGIHSDNNGMAFDCLLKVAEYL